MSRRRRVEEAHRATRRRWLLIGIVGALVIGAAIGAVLASSGGGGGGSSKVAVSTQTKPVSVDGTPLPPLNDPAKDSAVGMALPTISGQSFDGSPVVIKPDGKAKVVLGIAHWCPHCQREVPLLSANIRANPLPASVEMFSISTSVQPSAPNYPPQTWLEREHWPVPVLADDAKHMAADAIGLNSFPFFVFVDGQGKVVSRYTGEMPVTQFRATVDQLAASAPSS